ncbi:AT-hook motif nuclear-localized protein 7-like [Apium graveolens]|uniref:AT-hook motif nuclear-localized protein 7-like n=1 Tax=Apium graveolens TaxID=4045 RepID=UPI003D792359
MEGGIDLESPVILNGNEVPGSYHVEAGTQQVPASQFSYSVGPYVAPVVAEEQGVGPVESEVPAMAVEVVVGPVVSERPAGAVEQAVVAMPGANGVAAGMEMKKKRGRPRKYGPDGKPLSPMPISASIPLSGETWKSSQGDLFKKKKKKKQRLEFGSPGFQVPYSVGANFTPHMITVNAGEDVSMKIISFSQQGSRVICILAANGSVSNVTLHQPSSSGGTLTYEGHFEILSLSGSFMPTDSGGTKSRAGGMSVSLAGPDGRVLGGGLAGMLIAAGPVQVVIGSFLPGHQQEQKPKKQKSEVAEAFSPFPANHNSEQGTGMISKTPQQNPAPVSYFGNNLSFKNPVQSSTILGATNDISLSGGPKDISQTKFMVSC